MEQLGGEAVDRRDLGRQRQRNVGQPIYQTNGDDWYEKHADRGMQMEQQVLERPATEFAHRETGGEHDQYQDRSEPVERA